MTAAVPVRRPRIEAEDDCVLPFAVEPLDVRGRVVRLTMNSSRPPTISSKTFWAPLGTRVVWRPASQPNPKRMRETNTA